MRHSSCRLLLSTRQRVSQPIARQRTIFPRNIRCLVTLAIESSCDDTAVAVLSREPSPPSSPATTIPTKTSLLFNERSSSDSRAYGGILPLVAVRGHDSALAPLLRRAIACLPRAEDGVTPRRPDFVSVTRGPGMMPNLSVGLSAAKGLAVAWDVPLVGVHHMQAHALTPRLVRALGMDMPGGRTGEHTQSSTIAEDDSNVTGESSASSGPDFPFLSLLVSGGHTQLVHSASLTDHQIVATSRDNALGNLLDQTARVILPPDILASSPDVSYGRLLEAFAFPADQSDAENYDFFRPASSRAQEMADTPTGYAWAVPQPYRQTRTLAYSFASIHSDVHRIAASNPSMDVTERRALARHTMASAFGHLVGRLCLALEDRPSLRPAAKNLVVSGGVASNRFLMHVLRTTLTVRGWTDTTIMAPPIELCTDNAAMIAWAGMEMYEAGFHTDLSVSPIAKWPMDQTQGSGILGVEGWLRRDGF